MKKTIKYSIWGLLIVLFSSSCKEKLEIWDSETLEYAGRYVIQGVNSDKTDNWWYNGKEMRIYNTAQNVKNEVWMEYDHASLSFKSKFVLEGSKEGFKSVTTSFEQLENNIASVDVLPDDAPSAANLTTKVEKKAVRCAIEEGKIISKSASTLGGNKSDSIYVKMTLYGGVVTYKSYEIPESERVNPNTPEYRWRFESATRKQNLDMTYILSGYRYTGYPEDRF